MRKLVAILVAILLTATLWAQTPQKMSYQAIIRNSSNTIVASSAVGMRISILQGSVSGSVVYTETKTTTTNANGLVSIEIGGGSGFDAINWASGVYFIKTETDPLGGTNYSITGTNQLLSVPYALYSKTADNGITPAQATKLTGIAEGAEVNVNADWNATTGDALILNKPIIPVGINIGDMQYWNGSIWVKLPVGNPGQYLQLTSSFVPTWSGAAFPSITTNSISLITATTASISSTLTSDGGSNITSIGVCWSLAPNPTITDFKTTDGIVTGIFSSSISGLSSETIYYLRSYAINSAGTIYGNELSFKTASIALPTISTSSLQMYPLGTIAADSYMIGGGDVTNDGGTSVSERGICWSTTFNPTILNSKTTSGSGKGPFMNVNIGPFTEGVEYHVRAYATNSLGTNYGNDISFIFTVMH